MNYGDSDRNPFPEDEHVCPQPKVVKLPPAIKLHKEASFWTPKGEFEVRVEKSRVWPEKISIRVYNGLGSLLWEDHLSLIPAIRFVRAFGDLSLISAKDVIDAVRAS